MFRAAILAVLLPLNLVLWGTPILLLGLVKLLTTGRLRQRTILALAWLAAGWARFNQVAFDAILDTQWDIDGVDDLREDTRYLLISNHISWVDIFVVQRVFVGHAPFVRFFLKQQLIWLPIVGQACWALEFPFMKRYSKAYLERHPEKRGTDLETTRIACQRYSTIPVTILNFCEGTRYTPEKAAEQESPYRHLLRPRPGGISFVLASLGEQLDAVLDMTIAYPGHRISFWEFVSNRVPTVHVRVRRLAVPPEFLTTEVTEAGPVRDRFRAWIEALWVSKDEELARLVAAPGEVMS